MGWLTGRNQNINIVKINSKSEFRNPFRGGYLLGNAVKLSLRFPLTILSEYATILVRSETKRNASINNRIQGDPDRLERG